MTPAMKQYWMFKSKNFDKIVLFKLGKFYELFYEDALIGQKLLDLKLHGGKMHAGFPEKSLDKFGTKLASLGYKCVIVEQVETPQQTKERAYYERQNYGEKAVAKREVTQVITPGTHHDLFHSSYNPKYMWVFQNVGPETEAYALLVVEATTYQAQLVHMAHDDNLSFFKSLVYRLRPDEILFRAGCVSPVILKMFQTAFFKPVVTFLTDTPNNNYWSSLKLEDKAREVQDSNPYLEEQVSKIFMDASGAVDSGLKAMAENLNALMEYYKQLYLFDRFALIGRVEIMNPQDFTGNSMMLDSQALAHLEIIDLAGNDEGREKNSLFAFIDQTATFAGRRLLKRWLCHPLLDPEVINERYNAIEDLSKCAPLRDTFQKTIQGLMDLDRLSQRLFTYGVKYNPAVVYFEDISESRLRELRTFFNELRIAIAALGNLAREPTFKSQRLRFLCTPVRSGGGLPNALPIIGEFEKQIIWEENTPTPAVGLDKEYDNLREEICKIREKLMVELDRIKEKFGCEEISFVSTKQRYEVEIPEYILKARGKPKEYELTSKRYGHSRFITPETKQLVTEIEEVEERMKETLALFVKFIFKSFLEYRAVWTETLDVLSELDALASLSVVSDSQGFPMCRPEISGPCSKPFIRGKGIRHPILSLLVQNFKENDVELGGEKGNQFMFLTGPNMGGKSTMLRQIGVLVILAQMGSFVPATKFEFSVVDRVFTRLGASDRLMEDKSTFFIEMEETVNVLKHGTLHSLAIIDELGRGTSTFDGVAICEGVIHQMIHMGCRVLFASHYHMLVESCQKLKGIGFCYMDMVLDPQKDRVVFLYKLAQGVMRESQGVNAAKISGLQVDVVERAREMSIEFEHSLKYVNMGRVS